MEPNTGDNKNGNGRLAAAILLNVIITVSQFTGGIVSGSLALVSDAVHNLSDSFAIVLAWLAQRLGKRPVTRKSTFGFRRAEILAAFINALVLFGVSIYLITEAADRFFNLREIDYRWMLWLGILGILANGFSVFLLHAGKGKNINIRAAYLHLLGDAMTSAAVVAGALLIRFFGIYWVDPVITILISIYLFVQTIGIFKEATGILMQMAPSAIDQDAVSESLKSIDGIKGIHHIHIWCLSDEKVYIECHVSLEHDYPVSETGKILSAMEVKLKEGFQVSHLTVQFEFNPEHNHSCDC